jgi:hypothetical protein
MAQNQCNKKTSVMNQGLFDFDHEPLEVLYSAFAGELRSPSGVKLTSPLTAP